MVTTLRGDLFQSSCQVLVHPANCKGVMGKGLAAAFKGRHPDLEQHWSGFCEQGNAFPGETYLWAGENLWIANMTTKDHWRDPSHLEWIQTGLDALQSEMTWNKLTSVAIPAVGCGEGGLCFSDVRQLVLDRFEDSEFTVELYAPVC